MAGFTTLALAGLAGAGLFAATRNRGGDDVSSTNARGRSRGDNPATGTAVPRGSVGSDDSLGGAQPPDANLAASNAQSAAVAAADRARRRGAGANNPLAGKTSGVSTPGLGLSRRSLMAGGPRK